MPTFYLYAGYICNWWVEQKKPNRYIYQSYVDAGISPPALLHSDRGTPPSQNTKISAAAIGCMF